MTTILKLFLILLLAIILGLIIFSFVVSKKSRNLNKEIYDELKIIK